MKILIVGAGPAGLATANFLDKQKHQITIIEKESVFKTMGFGIFFFNEGKKILKKATHDPLIHFVLKAIGYKRYMDDTGRLLGDTHYNHLFHVNNYNSISSIKREDIHALLRKHLQKEVCIKMGTTISHIDNTLDYASVHLSDGTDEKFDLVISAEGSHSQLRELFFSFHIKILPWFARYFWLDRTLSRFTMQWSQFSTIMCMPHRKKTTMLSIENADIHEKYLRSKNIPTELIKFYESIGMNHEEITECYKHSYVAPMKYVFTDGWFKNRVVLIGDAQHAMTPTMGFGTSLALEDAYVLANTLNSLQTQEMLSCALQVFSKKRSRRIAILRSINRLTDFLSFRKSKLYYAFWYKHRFIAVKISQCIDGLIRLGWKYS